MKKPPILLTAVLFVLCVSAFAQTPSTVTDDGTIAAPATSFVSYPLMRLKAHLVASMLVPAEKVQLVRNPPPQPVELYYPTNPPQRVAPSIPTAPAKPEIEFANITIPDGVEQVSVFVPSKSNRLVVIATQQGHKNMAKLIAELEGLIKEEQK